MSEIKFTLEGTDYEFEAMFDSGAGNTPVLHFKGVKYVGKAIPKQPIEDYEITVLIGKDGSEIHKSAYTYPECFQTLVTAPDIFEIHTVLRRSDNEIFSIGDEVCINKKDEPKDWNGPIKSFWIAGDKKIHICYNGHHYDIKYFQKVKPIVPLFTTEDGVEMFEGEFYIYVDNNYGMTVYTAAKGHYQDKIQKNTFWNKNKAEQYILENKPIMVSLKELNIAITRPSNIRDYETVDNVICEIKDFFKSKINPINP